MKSSRRFRFYLAIFSCLGGICVPGRGWSQEAMVTLNTNATTWVGERVTLVVKLYAPGFFDSAPSYVLPNSPGLLLLAPDQHPIVSRAQINGTNYTVQRHEFSVFARRAGRQTIPPLTIQFNFKRRPLDTNSVAASVTTEAVNFTAVRPPGTDESGDVISARDLKVVETWKPEPGQAKTGDSFTRTISFTAADLPGTMFPPFSVGTVDGVGIYPQPPEIHEGEDGNRTGGRRDTVVYTCERPGQFVIPAVQLTWFDLASQKLQTVKLPAHSLDVAPNLALAATSGPATGSSRPGKKWLAVSAILLLFVIALLALAGSPPGRLLICWLRPIHLLPLNPVQSSRQKI